jgi:phosphatidylinositol-bisphosphatase
MYDILVLHLIGGKDIFVTVSGEYQKSCFGASINALCKMKVPIRELSNAKLMEFETKASADLVDSNSDDPYPVPKELWLLCDLISAVGLDTENLVG